MPTHGLPPRHGTATARTHAHCKSICMHEHADQRIIPFPCSPARPCPRMQVRRVRSPAPHRVVCGWVYRVGGIQVEGLGGACCVDGARFAVLGEARHSRCTHMQRERERDLPRAGPASIAVHLLLLHWNQSTLTNQATLTTSLHYCWLFVEAMHVE